MRSMPVGLENGGAGSRAARQEPMVGSTHQTAAARCRLLAAAEHADDRVIEDADVGDVSRPRRRGAGRGLVVRVARWSAWCLPRVAIRR
jgi:hypothetical protein